MRNEIVKYPLETGPLEVGETLGVMRWGDNERLIIRYRERAYLEKRLKNSYYIPSHGFKITKLHK